jgi:hypothetical protein
MQIPHRDYNHNQHCYEGVAGAHSKDGGALIQLIEDIEEGAEREREKRKERVL